MIKKIQVKDQSGNVTGTYDVGQVAPEVAEKIDNLLNEETGSIQYTTKTNGINVTLRGSNNINIEPREAIGTGEGKASDATNAKGGNIALKPGDDIELWAHHRGTSKNNEVSVKVLTESENDEIPTKLQLNASEILLTTKDKVGDNANVMDVTVNSAKNTKGYLKVRAQAIDLRSESHGGISLQPKGYDSDNHMNKIKFEHGGGDGLEFGTFNAEKTSIFTDEYRFNKDGVWKMSTRTKVPSDKADATDATTSYKYVKAADDFYDNIDNTDPTTTTENIIKTASAFNGSGVISKITKKGNLEVATSVYFECTEILDGDDLDNSQITFISDFVAVPQFKIGALYKADDIMDALYSNETSEYEDPINNAAAGDILTFKIPLVEQPIGTADWNIYRFKKYNSPSINLESENTIKFKADSEIEIKVGSNTCNASDIIAFINWAKTHGYGPFNTQQGETAPDSPSGPSLG